MTRPTLLAIASIAALTILGSALLQPAHALARYSTNFSSHLPEFFRDLLAGRVFVHERNGAPAAIHYRKDGTFYACWLADDASFRRSPDDSTWKIGSRSRASNIEHRTYHPRFGEQFFRRVLIYTPETGRFHFEAYFKTSNEWRIDRDGWIQDSWPQVLVDNCRDLDLPSNFPIDEAQTAYRFDSFKPHAKPIRNHPGSDQRFPGATGVAAAGNGPTLTPDGVEAAFRSYERNISISTRGTRYVFLSFPEHKEIWRLDRHLNVANVATMRLDPYNSVFITRWRTGGRPGRVSYGYPLFAVSTERPHPIFTMIDSVVDRQARVAIPNADGLKVEHRFHADGTVRTPKRSGTWRISAGKVEVTFDHLTHAYPWRTFAGFAGFKTE